MNCCPHQGVRRFHTGPLGRGLSRTYISAAMNVAQNTEYCAVHKTCLTTSCDTVPQFSDCGLPFLILCVFLEGKYPCSMCVQLYLMFISYNSTAPHTCIPHVTPDRVSCCLKLHLLQVVKIGFKTQQTFGDSHAPALSLASGPSM